MTRPLVVALAIAAAGVVLAAQTGPTDPVGVYAMLDHVVAEPNDAAPVRIQLWGAFVLAADSGGYATVARGYMYYACPAGQETSCRADWEDLKFVAGIGKAIGYGSRGKPLGTVHDEGAPVGSPDPYPIAGGIVKVESKDPSFKDLVAALKKAVRAGTDGWPAMVATSNPPCPRPPGS